LLVFAINDWDSFQFAIRKYEFIKEHKIPFILIGNKSDLKSVVRDGEYRGISYDIAKNQAKLWEIEYIETFVIFLLVKLVINTFLLFSRIQTFKKVLKQQLTWL